MSVETVYAVSGDEESGDGELARLVRFCAHVSRRPELAEDLAQETLLEAWRSRAKLRDPSGRWAWVAAIARNVWLRRARTLGREVRHAAEAYTHQEDGSSPLMSVPDGRADVEPEIENPELASLLDRALTLLPDGARAVLIARVIERVAIVDGGRIVAVGAPGELKASLGDEVRPEVVLKAEAESNGDARRVRGLLGELGRVVDLRPGQYAVLVPRDRLGSAVEGLITGAEGALDDFRLAPPNLGDVYIHLAGQKLEAPA